MEMNYHLHHRQTNSSTYTFLGRVVDKFQNFPYAQTVRLSHLIIGFFI